MYVRWESRDELIPKLGGRPAELQKVGESGQAASFEEGGRVVEEGRGTRVRSAGEVDGGQSVGEGRDGGKVGSLHWREARREARRDGPLWEGSVRTWRG